MKRTVATRISCDICGGDNHTPGECWPWQPEAERQRRYRLPFWKDRMRANGIDPKSVLKEIPVEAEVLTRKECV